MRSYIINHQNAKNLVHWVNPSGLGNSTIDSQWPCKNRVHSYHKAVCKVRISRKFLALFIIRYFQCYVEPRKITFFAEKADRVWNPNLWESVVMERKDHKVRFWSGRYNASRSSQSWICRCRNRSSIFLSNSPWKLSREASFRNSKRHCQLNCLQRKTIGLIEANLKG